MFTGIVEEVGVVRAISKSSASIGLTIDGPITVVDTRIGDSIAINGCCLTVVQMSGESMSFDAVPETVLKTSLRFIRQGDGVNLERALQVGGRLGGHFVQGHVDGVGAIKSITNVDNAHILRISVAANLLRYIVQKGSISVNGISLTVVDVETDSFTVWIIPHTYSNTSLRHQKIGDMLNIETDMLAKYLEKLMQPADATLSFSKLIKHGFAE